MKMGTLPVTEHQMVTGQPTHCIFQHVFPGLCRFAFNRNNFFGRFFGENDSKEPCVKNAYVLKGKDFHALTDPGAKKFKNVCTVRQAFLSVFHGNCQPKV